MVRGPIISRQKGGFVWTSYARDGQGTVCCNWAEQGRKPGQEWEASRSALQSRDSDQGLGTRQWGFRKWLLLTLQLVLVKLDL